MQPLLLNPPLSTLLRTREPRFKESSRGFGPLNSSWPGCARLPAVLREVQQPARPDATDAPLEGLRQRAVKGDRVAAEELVHRLGPDVLAVVRRSLGSGHEHVEDLFQESLVAVLGSLAQFRGESSLKHYARRITLRRCVDELRRQKSQKNRAAELARLPEEHTSPTLPIRDLLLSGLQTLPKEQAETLTMRYVLGYTVDEIAAAMDTPKNTVRGRLQVAKTFLKQRLGEREPERKGA